MSKAYTVTEEQLQNALYSIEINKTLERQIPNEGLRPIDARFRTENLEGNINGIVVTLALLGFDKEAKQALREARETTATSVGFDPGDTISTNESEGPADE